MPAELLSRADQDHGLLADIRARALEMKTPYMTQMCGLYNPSGGRVLLDGLKAAVNDAVGKPVYPVCTFARIASHGAALEEHTDRDGLDWTVTVTLQCDRPWSLQTLSNGCWIDNDTPERQGVLVNSSAIMHRRQAYAGDCSIALFAHYTEDPRRENDRAMDVDPPPPVIVRGLLSAADLDRVYTAIDVSKIERGTVNLAAKRRPAERDSQVLWLRDADGWSWLDSLLASVVHQENAARWHESLRPPHDAIQFTRYLPGHHFAWHRDAVERDGRIRKISMTVVLRAAEVGGVFEYGDFGPVELAPGDAVLFPSGHLHRVTPVTAGVRDSLVMWLSGPARSA